MGGMSGMGAPPGGFGGMGGMGAPPGGFEGMGAQPMMSVYGSMGTPLGGFMASMVARSSDAYGDSTGNVNSVQVSNGEEDNNNNPRRSIEDGIHM
jgi:hypothetical protein